MSGKAGKKSCASVKERLLRENWRNRTCNKMGKMRNEKNTRIVNGSERTKTLLELKLVKDVKGNKKPAASI